MLAGLLQKWSDFDLTVYEDDIVVRLTERVFGGAVAATRLTRFLAAVAALRGQLGYPFQAFAARLWTKAERQWRTRDRAQLAIASLASDVVSCLAAVRKAHIHPAIAPPSAAA
ncbi:hypothetical protein LBW62_19085 [Ralstonia solanacearum]|uniref:hypothetical protein n=1 Tax=Ralstonia solanacearum TaxID=305 RepID=UPI0005C5973D|nr:hypothetical protein [Ralstonia solanacearum]MDB0543310.1 hypothetical protein [Ralstonia solanacearum]MDB0553480.1 hypothetical protein [Ralstonia solanacearum]MDB0558290.1 hypothetical protein [Ralstonia solanacearum]